MTWIDVLLAFAPLVVVPAALPLVGVDRGPHPLLRLAPLIALLLPTGALAGLVAAAWLVWCCTLVLGRASAWWRRPEWSITAIGAVVACVYLGVGAGWLVVSRLGWRPFGFGETIVELTAVHFHYAGFTAVALAVAARGRIAVIAVAAGSVFVAAGHFGEHVLDVAGAVALTVGLLLLAAAAWRRGGVLLRVSALAVPASMALALVYALGRLDIGPSIAVDRMAQVHGTLNALALSWAGALGWRAVR